ncbi:MAG TPA: alpha/beta fold hydrolase [Anaerolineales bacterium]|nr:alpha/beta fold hydrolase [Anaerolineales bacterium]
MRVPNDTQLIGFGNWTLRVRPAAQKPARVLLLLHGWTGDENSMWVFMRNLALDYWTIAPRAPHAGQPGGYSWRGPAAPQHAQPGGRRAPRLEDFRPSAEALIALVDEYAAQNELDAHRFDVIGFSQGAALTNAIALLHPERIRRAGVLAGFLPAGSEPLIEKRPLSGRPFFVAHGTLDEMVQIEQARRSVEMLERAGASVTFCEDEVGHKLSANCLRALEEFFE